MLLLVAFRFNFKGIIAVINERNSVKSVDDKEEAIIKLPKCVSCGFSFHLLTKKKQYTFLSFTEFESIMGRLYYKSNKTPCLFEVSGYVFTI